MARNKAYSQEEIDYIESKWGVISVKVMSKKLNRSVNSIMLKAGRIGLGDSRKAGEDVTLHLFSTMIGISYTTLKVWIKKYEFPVKKRAFVQRKVLMVNFKNFWKWAESHKEMMDFTKFNKGDLGVEPAWVEAQRRNDFEKKKYRRKQNTQAWTTSEDKKLIFLLEQHKYTFPDIAKELGRSEGAIKQRLEYLNIKLRPVKLETHKKYTAAEEQFIKDGIAAGKSIEVIAYEMNRSAMGVRGKLERWGYKFKCGVPYAPEPESFSISPNEEGSKEK